MSDPTAEIKDRYATIRQEIRDEYGQIASRLSWYVSSQAFLVSGFAISGNPAFPLGWFNHYLVPGLAYLLSILVAPSILGAAMTIKAWTARKHQLFDTVDPDASFWFRIERPHWISPYALMVPVSIPILFLLFWNFVIFFLVPASLAILVGITTLIYGVSVGYLTYSEFRHIH